jgi:hypothetical protein
MYKKKNEKKQKQIKSETLKVEKMEIKTGRKLDKNNYSMEIPVGKRTDEAGRKPEEDEACSNMKRIN